jgi:beta-lactamase regulating signal transducer with metallopeptidase domain
MKDGKTFSIADVIALSIDPIWIQVIVCAAGIGSIIASLLYLRRIVLEKRRTATIIAESTQILMHNSNDSLIAWMKKRQVTLATSNAISSPCLVEKTVLFPTQLFRDLSEEEAEAIIVHEMAHFRWRDCGVRIVCSLIAALFWWIPTKGVRKRIEEMQEQAADAAIHQFKIPGTVLARAILKTAVEKKRARSLLSFSLVGNQSRLKKRIGLLLREPTPSLFGWRVVQYGLLCCAMVSILFGTLWIF